MTVDPLTLALIASLSKPLNIPIRLDPTGANLSGRPAAFGGTEVGILLSNPTAHRLDLANLRSNRFPRQTAQALYTLAHEYGHYKDMGRVARLGGASTESQEMHADRYADRNFRRFAALLGARPQRVNQLWSVYPRRPR